MKKSILLIAVLLAAAIVHSQEIPAKSVPKQVQEAIKNVFPELIHATNAPIKWKRNGLNYKASLYASTPNPASIELDSLGHVLMVERRVGPESLAPKAKEFLKSQYKGTEMEISEVYMITTKGKNSFRTKLIVKPVYIFDSKGEIITPGNETKSK
jgi:hypothetical protein